VIQLKQDKETAMQKSRGRDSRLAANWAVFFSLILVLSQFSAGVTLADGPQVPEDENQDCSATWGSGEDRSSGSRHPGLNAAELTDFTRCRRYDDFIRVVWPNPGSRVDQITFGKRAFFTASVFFQPPGTVEEFLRYVGNYVHEGRDLAVMRCIPTREERKVVQPILATWPNVFKAIRQDLAGPGKDCNSPTLTPGEKEICQIAISYHDTPQTVYSAGLAYTLTLGSQMFATPESTAALRTDYGIFPAFTGLGFSVKDSALPVTGDTTPLKNRQILRNSIVPEYLLRNAPLAEANCRCVQVPLTPNLPRSILDPDFVWTHGVLDQGACRKLGAATWGDGARNSATVLH
jgi:hypothetical protein